MRVSRSLLLISLAIWCKEAFCFSVAPIQQAPPRLSLATTLRSSVAEGATAVTEETSEKLPALFPSLAQSLSTLGFSSPTPIQEASAKRSLEDENLLLIAPTGSGKTLAYLLPTLTRAVRDNGTVLVVAPTRELAVQLMRDTMTLVKDDDTVLLTVRGVDLPTPAELQAATVLIGTPAELLTVLTSIRGGYNFVAGGTLSAVILDEVDVLLPLTPKALRTSLDSTKTKEGSNTPQDERRRQEQRRKLMAAKRQGVQLTNDNKQIVSPTEKLLGLVASGRFAGGTDTLPPQVLAGSATASRKTLDRLNRALRGAADQASSTFDLVWSRDVKACRPEIDSSQRTEEHTIRAVTVPSQVEHRYICLDKEKASSASAVLEAVAKATQKLNPQTSLLFLCGQFGKAITKQKKEGPRAIRGATSKARREALRKSQLRARAAADTKKSTSTERLSARSVCKTLAPYGIDAQPLHVALGLELNAKDDEEIASSNPFFVTFEGSARGLHFDKVDAVFVVGRPASAASYLHLAGRVGRASPNGKGEVVIQPGTVVSICTAGSAKELEKWTQQVGGSDLEELEL